MIRSYSCGSTLDRCVLDGQHERHFAPCPALSGASSTELLVKIGVET
jgi:hypothetical protein